MRSAGITTHRKHSTTRSSSHRTGTMSRVQLASSVAPTMKHRSENQPQEVLAGLVERVTYHNAENGFCVLRAKARGHRDIVTVVGHAATIAAGEWITASILKGEAEGDTEQAPDPTHPRWNGACAA